MRFLYLFFIGHYYGELLKAKDLIPFMLSDEYWAQGALSKGSSNLGHKFLNAFKVSSMFIYVYMFICRNISIKKICWFFVILIFRFSYFNLQNKILNIIQPVLLLVVLVENKIRKNQSLVWYNHSFRDKQCIVGTIRLKYNTRYMFTILVIDYRDLHVTSGLSAENAAIGKSCRIEAASVS